jgi:hypothetical protein
MTRRVVSGRAGHVRGRHRCTADVVEIAWVHMEIAQAVRPPGQVRVAR